MTGVETALALAPYILQAIPAIGGLFSDNPSEYFLGSPAKTTQLPTMNPQQQGLQGDIISQLQQVLQGGQSPFEGNLVQNYNKNVLPGISERYGRNGPGSALQQALEQSGQSLLGDMSNQRMDFVRNLLPYAFNSSFENRIDPAQQGALPGIISGFANTAANQANNYANDDRFNQLINALRGGQNGGQQDAQGQQNNIFSQQQRDILGGALSLRNNQSSQNVLGGAPTKQNPQNMRLRDVLGLLNQNARAGATTQGLSQGNPLNLLQQSGLNGGY